MLLRETKGRAAWSQNISEHPGLVTLLSAQLGTRRRPRERGWPPSGHLAALRIMQGHDKCLCEQPHLVQRRRDETKLSCIEQHTANTKILQEAQDRGQTWGWCNFANMMIKMTQIIKYKHHCLMQVFILVRQTVSPISILTVPHSRRIKSRGRNIFKSLSLPNFPECFKEAPPR